MNVLFEEDGGFKAGSIMADNDSSLHIEMSTGSPRHRLSEKSLSVIDYEGWKSCVQRNAFEGHYGGDATPRVRWAGDLDGDGRADLLISLPDDNCGFDDRLYLSSAAGPGQLVGLVAHFAGRHPACGC